MLGWLLVTVPLAPGSLFAHDYRIVRPLSAGGMGALYVAEQISTHQLRALKLMHGQLLTDESSRRRFEQEARIAASIPSEHVVEVHATGIDPQSGLPFMAMELLEGEDLAAMVHRRGALAPAEVRVVMEQVCHAVGAAHQAGIVHRDLKPSNVFVARARRTDSAFVVKVLDFGIAKLISEGPTQTTGIGSPLCLAPEQAGQGQVTPATDVWALGLLAYFLLTGASFWTSAMAPQTSIAEVMREVLVDPIPAASARAMERGSALPPGFDAWFAWCLNRDPAGRFPNAHEAFARLAPLLPQGGALGPDLGVPLGVAAELPAAYQSYPSMGSASAALSGFGPPTGSAQSAIWGASPGGDSAVIGSRAKSGASQGLAVGCLVGAALVLLATVGLGVVVYSLMRPPTPAHAKAATLGPEAPASPSETALALGSARQVAKAPLGAGSGSPDVTTRPTAGIGAPSAALQPAGISPTGPSPSTKQNAASSPRVAASPTATTAAEKPSSELAWQIAKAVANIDIKVCLYSQITRPNHGMFAEHHTVTVRFDGTKLLGVSVQGNSMYPPAELRNGYRNGQPPTQAEVDAELGRILTCIRGKVGGVGIPNNQARGTVVSKFSGPDVYDAAPQ
jgi:tRNA A-37 threonylcarbamoyl transferase component Bud32